MSLVVRDLACGYGGRTVIAGVSFQVQPGELVALLGPNGVGKSTLLRCLLGLMPLRRGEVHWSEGGRRLPVAGMAGYVPQVTAVPFAYSVRDVVLMGRARHVGLFALPGPRDQAAAAAALRRVGIEHLAGRPFPALSGGERQLVLIARALAAEPRLLVLDEPEAHLDLRHRLAVMDLLRRLSRDEGLAVLFSTHHPEDVLWYADRALLLFPDGEARDVPVPGGLDEDALARLYGVPLVRMRLNGWGTPPWVIVPGRWQGHSPEAHAPEAHASEADAPEERSRR
ncbi:MAG TPA: ABC transporter ATP-binding protein [Thermaerobacter sp.]